MLINRIPLRMDYLAQTKVCEQQIFQMNGFQLAFTYYPRPRQRIQMSECWVEFILTNYCV